MSNQFTIIAKKYHRIYSPNQTLLPLTSSYLVQYYPIKLGSHSSSYAWDRGEIGSLRLKVMLGIRVEIGSLGLKSHAWDQESRARADARDRESPLVTPLLPVLEEVYIAEGLLGETQKFTIFPFFHCRHCSNFFTYSKKIIVWKSEVHHQFACLTKPKLT